MINQQSKDFIQDLYRIGAIKFGNFTLKNGSSSPIYCDMRLIMSHPKLLQQLSDLLIKKLKDPQLICAVPYAALPLATAMSLASNIPMIMLRKEEKGHGMKQQLEGIFKAGQTCAVIEDVVTTGSSIASAITMLQSHGLGVQQVLCLIDRRDSAQCIELGYELESLFTLEEILNVIANKVKQSRNVEDALDCHARRARNDEVLKRRSFTERASTCKHPTTKRLFEIAAAKKSNLILAADVVKKAELLKLADELGPELCVLKTHIDIIDDFDEELPFLLQKLAQQHNFLIWEDRKFADIGAATVQQYVGGIFHIADWADLITVHTIAGHGTLDALASVPARKKPACMLIAEMSSKGSLAQGDYTQATVKLAHDYPEIVIGFVCQRKLSNHDSFVHCTPGVQFAPNNDAFGQQYITPEMVICERSNDFIVVGRGIIQAPNMLEAAQKYRLTAWNAYEKSQA